MNNLLSRVVIGIAAGVAVYIGFSIWADASAVGDALARFSWWTAIAGLGLAAANYLLRFVRWHYYLQVLKIEVPLGESFLVFLSGFALTVTPGKLGEAIKALLLKQSRGIPAMRTAPIVLAERLTDLIGLLLLTAVGMFSFEVDRRFIAAGVLIAGVALAFASIEPLALSTLQVAAKAPFVGRFSNRLAEAHASAAVMLKPRPLMIAVGISVASWFFECLAFWLITNGFEGASIELHPANFIYAAMTVAGALSFLPGGLGVTEAGMLLLLGRLGVGITRGTATAATFVTRVCTLWFAVAVGVIALVVFTRRHALKLKVPAPDANQNKEP